MFARLGNFKHEPLDLTRPSIRLLEVLPGVTKTGHIRCRLRHATVDAEYSCLSYTWGPPDAGFVLLVNGKFLRVRKNLFDFLHVAQQQSAGLLLWIDAVCIDQDNTGERNHQVAQMGAIYRRAAEVIVWLGKDDLADLSLSAYWSRAWITQEIVLARKIKMFAGRTEIDPSSLENNFARIAHRFGRSEFHPISKERCLEDMPYKKVLDGNGERRGILAWLDALPDRKCQERRDKVYSLLAIASDGDAVKVDYASSEEVFMTNVLQATKRSLCLCSLPFLASRLEFPLSFFLRCKDLVFETTAVAKQVRFSRLTTKAGKSCDFSDNQSTRYELSIGSHRCYYVRRLYLLANVSTKGELFCGLIRGKVLHGLKIGFVEFERVGKDPCEFRLCLPAEMMLRLYNNMQTVEGYEQDRLCGRIGILTVQ